MKKKSSGAPSPPESENKILRYDFTDAGNYSISGSNVTGATDLFGNENHAAPPSGSEPQTSAEQVNGLGSIYFNVHRLVANFSIISQPITTAVVLRNITGRAIFDSYNNVQHALYDNAIIAFGTGRSLDSVIPVDAWATLILEANGGGSRLVVNQTAHTFAASPGTNGLSGISIGNLRGNPNPVAAGYGKEMYLAEIFSYAEVNATLTNDILTYFSEKYNLY